VLQCVAVGCSGLQYVAECRSVLYCVGVWCSVLQCFAVFFLDQRTKETNIFDQNIKETYPHTKET